MLKRKRKKGEKRKYGNGKTAHMNLFEEEAHTRSKFEIEKHWKWK